MPKSKVDKIHKIKTPYSQISVDNYEIEKRRLQIALLNIQNSAIENNKRIAIVFEGRDAAGKGSTIKRFTENLMSRYFRIVELGIPTQSESKYWFKRYQKNLPQEGEIVFFDRSWYNRAMIEPTMGYCSEKRYKYFMRKVLNWEHQLIDEGLILIKIYLSIGKDTQLLRFDQRINDELKFWKFSENDEKVRDKWERLTNFKDQMFQKTSSKESPWVIINSNVKKEARLTAMLYVVNQLNTDQRFKPLTKLKKKAKSIDDYQMRIKDINFDNLSHEQYQLLKSLINKE